MLHTARQLFIQSAKLSKTVVLSFALRGFAIALATFFVGASVFTLPSSALASSKVATPEALDMAISEAAQEFVDSILDDYADILESSFDTAYDPLKSAVKGLSKQVSKASKPSKKGDDAAAAPELMIAAEPFETAAASFKTLQEQTAAFQAQLENAPTVVSELIEAQLGAKMDELNAAFATVSEAVDQIVEDTTTLSASNPDSTTAFSEHATMLTQAVDAVDVVIDSFDS
ncbi:MAG: hypothetical protein AAFR18_19970 [Cyanobacteria bacterium J06627_32]